MWESRNIISYFMRHNRGPFWRDQIGLVLDTAVSSIKQIESDTVKVPKDHINVRLKKLKIAMSAYCLVSACLLCVDNGKAAVEWIIHIAIFSVKTPEKMREKICIFQQTLGSLFKKTRKRMAFIPSQCKQIGLTQKIIVVMVMCWYSTIKPAI